MWKEEILSTDFTLHHIFRLRFFFFFYTVKGMVFKRNPLVTMDGSVNVFFRP